MNNIPTFFLIEELNWYEGNHNSVRYYKELETELQLRIPESTQLCFGEPDGEAIILPFELFDDNGYEIIEPVAYDNYGEPIW